MPRTLPRHGRDGPGRALGLEDSLGSLGFRVLRLRVSGLGCRV